MSEMRPITTSIDGMFTGTTVVNSNIQSERVMLDDGSNLQDSFSSLVDTVNKITEERDEIRAFREQKKDGYMNVYLTFDVFIALLRQHPELLPKEVRVESVNIDYSRRSFVVTVKGKDLPKVADGAMLTEKQITIGDLLNIKI